jgi:predicted DNA-binding transcriptional regulator AlpA
MSIKDNVIAASDEAADFAQSFSGDPGREGAQPSTGDDDVTVLTAAEVEKATTLDIKTIDTLVGKDRFPAPIRLSDRRRAWRRADVLRWLADPIGWVSF